MPTDKKITDLTALAAASVDAAADYFALVDASDTTMGSTGTTKKVLLPALDDGQGTAVNVATANKVKIDVQIDVQEFTATGTWTKPSWALATSLVEVIAVGPGGSGGSGDRGPAGAIRGGGGGGASGCYSRVEFLAGDLGATEAVVVGTAGAVGAAISGSDAVGNAGATGTDTLFGTIAAPQNAKVVAAAGKPGSGGTTLVGGAGGTTGIRGMFPGMPGAKGGGDSAAPTITNDGTFGAPNTNVGGGLATGGGGGGGMGITAANAISDGSDGGTGNAYTGGVAGGVHAISNANGLAGTSGIYLAGGGGGGGRDTTGAQACTGGAGGVPGGGGGGGGAAVGFNSGAGGLGGRGLVRVITRI